MDKQSTQVGLVISQIRNRHTWSQERLAREIGVTAKSVYRWEKGVSSPNRTSLQRILHLQSIDYLFNELTEKEKEILGLLIENNTPNKTLADMLYISNNTLRSHLKSIMKKLNVHNRKDAVKVALQRKMM